MGTQGNVAVLVPGGRGQLGSDLAGAVTSRTAVTALGSAELDITDAAATHEAVAGFAAAHEHPVVLNAAAYTAVDAAESDVDTAFAVNARGPENLAAACKALDVPLVHVSTDYVFDGTASTPYTPADEPNPISVYGRSKLAGEQAVLGSGAQAAVVRTAWVYGAAGKNFVKTMARLESQRDAVTVVNDQHGAPTWSAHLAAGLLRLAVLLAGGAGPAGQVLHCTSGGATTWWAVARAVFAELGADPERVLPCSSAEYVLPAPRPPYSVLSVESWCAAGLDPLPDWRAALAEAFATDGVRLRP